MSLMRSTWSAMAPSEAPACSLAARLWPVACWPDCIERTAASAPSFRRWMIARISSVEALGTAGQRAHLVGDHGETATQFARAGCLDGGVEGEQVGLLGNATDHRQHLIDARHLAGQFAHGTGGFADFAGHALAHLQRATHHAPRIAGLVAGLL
jgi:hypothetical protein